MTIHRDKKKKYTIIGKMALRRLAFQVVLFFTCCRSIASNKHNITLVVIILIKFCVSQIHQNNNKSTLELTLISIELTASTPKITVVEYPALLLIGKSWPNLEVFGMQKSEF